MGTKQFLSRVLLFGMIALPILALNSLYCYYTKSYELAVNGSEVYFSIKKSKVSKKVNILIIGDSLGKQLYDNDTYNDTVYSLTCNQAISMVGFYILLENFIEKNKKDLPGRVILIIAPGTLANNLDQIYSYHYFLKPFYKPGNEKYFTATCIKQIRKIPFYYTAQLPVIVNSNWSPEYNNRGRASYTLISPLSNEYLLKIKSVCSVNHIPFSIYCPPLTTASMKKVSGLSADTYEFKKCGLRREFEAYFKNIRFLPDSLFQDHMHFKKQYIPADYFGLCKN